MSILIKVIADILCGVCDYLGGYHFLWMRRYIMPLVIGITVSLVTHVWWCGLLVLPEMGTLCIGYSKDGNFGRALWIGLQCFVLGLGLLLTHHLHWYLFLPYIVLGCVLGGLYKNWQQIIGDLVTGCYMGSIIFLVH
jgi:hypothetical protein